jgi:hypothetical protein
MNDLSDEFWDENGEHIDPVIAAAWRGLIEDGLMEPIKFEDGEWGLQLTEAGQAYYRQHLAN